MSADLKPSPTVDWRETLAAINTLVERLRSWASDNTDQITNLLRIAHRHVIFERAGWIPHYTTPFDLIRDDVTNAELSELLNNYYRQNWTAISAEFRTRLQTLDVDEEAKATFCEGLDTHGAGYHRAATRLLFPEIERVARVELLEGKLRGIASLRDVRNAAGQRLGLSELEPSGGGPVWAQFSRMSRHLYEVVETPEQAAKFASDPVPNRHAALHGVVVYDKLQNSLNALIMTEFMFQVVTALKASLVESAEQVGED